MPQVNIDVFRPHLEVTFMALLLSLPLRSWKHDVERRYDDEQNEPVVFREYLFSKTSTSLTNILQLKIKTLSTIMQRVLFCYSCSIIASLAVGCSTWTAAMVVLPLAIVSNLVIAYLLHAGPSLGAKKFLSSHKRLILFIQIVGITVAVCVVLFLTVLNLAQELPRMASSAATGASSLLVSLGVEKNTLMNTGSSMVLNVSSGASDWYVT